MNRDQVRRFIALTDWARDRYSYRNDKGQLCWLAFGPGLQNPSRYTRIEDMAAVRYLGHAERYPGRPIRDCVAA